MGDAGPQTQQPLACSPTQEHALCSDFVGNDRSSAHPGCRALCDATRRTDEDLLRPLWLTPVTPVAPAVAPECGGGRGVRFALLRGRPPQVADRRKLGSWRPRALARACDGRGTHWVRALPLFGLHRATFGRTRPNAIRAQMTTRLRPAPSVKGRMRQFMGRDGGRAGLPPNACASGTVVRPTTMTRDADGVANGRNTLLNNPARAGGPRSIHTRGGRSSTAFPRRASATVATMTRRAPCLRVVAPKSRKQLRRLSNHGPPELD